MTNVLRTQMVAAAVQRAHDGKLPINIKNVSLFLPGPGAFTAELKAQPAFELDLDDLSPYLPPDKQPPLPPEVLERLKDAVIELPDNPGSSSTGKSGTAAGSLSEARTAVART